MFNKVNKWQILERNKQLRDRSLSGGGGGGRLQNGSGGEVGGGVQIMFSLYKKGRGDKHRNIAHPLQNQNI